jgi:hypothetical protein
MAAPATEEEAKHMRLVTIPKPPPPLTPMVADAPATPVTTAETTAATVVTLPPSDDADGISMAYASDETPARLPPRMGQRTTRGAVRSSKWCEQWSPQNRLMDTWCVGYTNKILACASWLVLLILCLKVTEWQHIKYEDYPPTGPAAPFFRNCYLSGLLFHETKVLSEVRSYLVPIIIYAVHAVYHTIASTCNYLYYEHLVHHTHFMGHVRSFLLSAAFLLGVLLVTGMADSFLTTLLFVIQAASLALLGDAEVRAFVSAEVVNGQSLLPDEEADEEEASGMRPPTRHMLRNSMPDYRVLPIHVGVPEWVMLLLSSIPVIFALVVIANLNSPAPVCMMTVVMVIDVLGHHFVRICSQRWFKWTPARNELFLICFVHTLSLVYCLSLLYVV